jgi:DNA repair protein RecN (Recombination protein N)
MLTRLRIENLAVVEDVVLVFGPGLNVLTGSTGAGKSLILGAVNLLLGEKASAEVIRQGADDALVEATFKQPSGSDPAGEVTVARRVSRAGRSHAMVNGRAVPVRELRALCERLIEPHGQNEQFRLRDPERHVDYVDAFADNAELRTRYATDLAEWRRARAELDRHDAEVARLREQRELYAHRVEEIDRVAPRPGEKAGLETRARMMANAERIHAALTEACAALYDDDAAAAALIGGARKRVAAVGPLDDQASRIEDLLAQAESLVGEAASRARSTLESLDFESDEVERVQVRLDQINRLEQRHRTDIETLIGRRETWVRELASLEDAGEEREQRAEQVTRRARDVAASGVALTESRRRAAREIDHRVTSALADLAMGGAVLRTEIAHAPDAHGDVEVDGRTVAVFDHGLDVVRMRIRTNPGEAEGPLESVASTGELSRVALVLKPMAAATTPGATLVFDEIDAGVGADLGGALAEKLLALAARHQIICVTHMPQIAARGRSHLVVLKETDGDRTRVRVRRVEGDERTREIARMLGGEEGSERRTALATEMLGDTGREKSRTRVRP